MEMQKGTLSRRKLLGNAAVFSAAGSLTRGTDTEVCAVDNSTFRPQGNINHSIVYWCYEDYFTVEEICRYANRIGCKSVELLAPKHWPVLKKYDLKCAIAGSHLFVQGMNNPRYHAGCKAMLQATMNDAADAQVPTVITFTGYAEETGEWAEGGIPDLEKLPKNQRVIDPEEGLRNCVAAYKEMAHYAERKGVNLSLEMLNTRDHTHPMKGHPGYQGDHIDYCMEIIKQVGSPRLGLLFDIYHVQIMDGDLIRRLEQCQEVINHVHTAGNPGRAELDDQQEINYPAVMRALVAQGYQGYVGHEFLPTRDPQVGLLEAVQLCDV